MDNSVILLHTFCMSKNDKLGKLNFIIAASLKILLTCTVVIGNILNR